MKWIVAGVVAALVLDLHVPPADACGIKLIIKTSTPRKSIARSSNPSHLLLLGTPPHRLERELSAAGHDVEVAPNIGGAKRTSYAVVVVDLKEADESRAKFPGSFVIVRSGDVVADLAAVEGQVARKPLRTEEPRQVVDASSGRRPVAAGPADRHPVIAAREPGATATPVEDRAPAPAPAVAATVQPPPVEQGAVRPTKPAAAPAPHDDVYFGVGSAAIGRKIALDRAARWLTERPNIQVVIEGYADPTGSHERNLTLGQTRAESVRDYLVSAGIDASRMEVISYGDTRLKYGRSDPRNRRVAIQAKN
jgi:outer membrane protein OmpA-like peptidoglycan-associated protein